MGQNLLGEHGHLSELELIALARAGDDQALGTLVVGYDWVIRSIARRHHIPEGEIDDFTQGVSEKIIIGLPTLREEASFGGWVRTVAYRTAMDYWRERNGGFRTVPLDDDEHPDPPARVDRGDLAVAEFLDKLPQELRSICEILISSHRTKNEWIAHHLGISVRTVYSRRKELRARLAHWLGVDDDGANPTRYPK